MARLIWSSTAIAWAVASLAFMAGATYWEPVAPLDWTAVIAYTVALVLLGLALVFVGLLVPSRKVRITAVIAAIPPIVTGLANLVEDGFDVDALGSVYVTGSLLTVAGLVVLAAALLVARAPRLAALCLLVIVGLFFVVAGGGLVLLVLFTALAARTAWFRSGPAAVADAA